MAYVVAILDKETTVKNNGFGFIYKSNYSYFPTAHEEKSLFQHNNSVNYDVKCYYLDENYGNLDLETFFNLPETKINLEEVNNDLLSKCNKVYKCLDEDNNLNQFTLDFSKIKKLTIKKFNSYGKNANIYI